MKILFMGLANLITPEAQSPHCARSKTSNAAEVGALQRCQERASSKPSHGWNHDSAPDRPKGGTDKGTR
jgi:hypothetical protein